MMAGLEMMLVRMAACEHGTAVSKVVSKVACSTLPSDDCLMKLMAAGAGKGPPEEEAAPPASPPSSASSAPSASSPPSTLPLVCAW